MAKQAKIWTRDEIKAKLNEDPKWVERGIVAIYKRQTEDEKRSEATKIHNGVGFNKVDAGFLTSLAKAIEKYGRLTPKQLTYGRKKVMKYSGQLVKIANNEIS